MSNIQRYDKKETMAVTLQSVGDVAKAGRMDSLANDVRKLISRAVLYRGQTITEKDLTAMAWFYVGDLKDEFACLGVKEIEQIFHLGIRGKLGEYFGINAGTLYDWTREYCENHRAEYLRSREDGRPAPQLEQKTEISQEDSDRMVADCINRNYRDYRASIAIPIAAGCEFVPQGDISSIAEKIVSQNGVSARKYPPGHPLFDPGDHQIKWLHAHGYAGTLKEIFDKGIALNEEEVVRWPR